MQIFYNYDSGKLLKEKFTVVGLKATCSDLRIQEILDELLNIAIEEFKDEISRKFSLIQLFEDENGERMLETYSKYFKIPDEYFSHYFTRNFFNPNNINSNWIFSKKEMILKKYDDFNEILFDDTDLDKLKLSYVLNYLYDSYSLSSIYSKRNLTYFYPAYFKKSEGTGNWKE